MTREYEPGGAHESIARLFGRRSDGSYQMPDELGSADDLWPLIRRVAVVSGVEVEEVLDMDWIKILEDLLLSVVRTEAMEFRLHVAMNGITRPERSLAELMTIQAADGLLPPS